VIEPPHGLCAILINLSLIAYRKRIEQKKESDDKAITATPPRHHR
jgi:hypothetical protein